MVISCRIISFEIMYTMLEAHYSRHEVYDEIEYSKANISDSRYYWLICIFPYYSCKFKAYNTD